MLATSQPTASFATLRSVITVELLGLEKLTSAFGLLLLFQGLAVTIGSPIAGNVTLLRQPVLRCARLTDSFFIQAGFLTLLALMTTPSTCPDRRLRFLVLCAIR